MRTNIFPTRFRLEGEQQGLQKGLQEGQRAANLKLARKLLAQKKMSPEEVTELTELDLTEILSLQREVTQH